MPNTFTIDFAEVDLAALPLVGGKNASIGEMIRDLAPLGVRVPGGFAVTTAAYRKWLEVRGIGHAIHDLLAGVKRDDVPDLVARSERIRELAEASPLPGDVAEEVVKRYRELSRRFGANATDVAVRSSATQEDLPTASFAGQQESYLNVRGEQALLESIVRAFGSLFTPRAIGYRLDMGFDPASAALSVGVQKMVRSDRASSGVIFTLDPESGHRGVVLVSSSWGLGESVVQGRVVPDVFWIHKAGLARGKRALVGRKLGAKEVTLVYGAGGGVLSVETAEAERARFSLTDEEALTLARWALDVERHYSERAGRDTPMDLEWAKDGETGQLFIVQARPETVHAAKAAPRIPIFKLRGKGEELVTGIAVGESVATGRARAIATPAEQDALFPGEILVTRATDPDWEPVLKRCAAVITEQGGRTSHAAIVARELGIPAVVGARGAIRRVPGGELVTVSCAEGSTGVVYRGEVPYEVEQVDPASVPRTRTLIEVNLGDPDKAFSIARLPCDGVGLARMEFVLTNAVKVHPMAIVRYASLAPELRGEVDAATGGAADKPRWFVERLAEGIATIAAAFHPRPVIVRFSDFKTNEYAGLVGGEPFEPHEENPMIGWRGASRYYHEAYKDGFALEVAAMRRVREELGLTNAHVMIPFCRTPAEGKRVLDTMRAFGLARGQEGLEVWVMAEIPSNVILAAEFADLFDGFSIGSNDLTQLTLGIDRDSPIVASIFDDTGPAIRLSCERLIKAAHAKGRPVGICGQAPSDSPDFAAFLVKLGIDAVSVNPDAYAKTAQRVAEVEKGAEDVRLAAAHH